MLQAITLSSVYNLCTDLTFTFMCVSCNHAVVMFTGPSHVFLNRLIKVLLDSIPDYL